MAELVGMIKFKGQLDNLVAYYLNGKLIVRRKTSVDKNRINTDKAFKNTRKVNKEFGASSSLSKAFRNSLKAIPGMSFHRSTHSFLTAIFHRLIRNGQGIVGQRTFNWNEANIDLAGLFLSKSVSPEKYEVSNVTNTNDGMDIPEQSISFGALQNFDEIQARYFLLQLPTIAFDNETDSYKINRVVSPHQTSPPFILPVVEGVVNLPNHHFNQGTQPAVLLVQLEEVNQSEGPRNPLMTSILGVVG
jgi:hypothetical protein